MSAEVGLYEKYRIERIDGKPVRWCFVLEDKDPLAVVALDAYAQIAEAAGYESLAADLREKVGDLAEGHLGLRGEHACGEPRHDRFALANVRVDL